MKNIFHLVLFIILFSMIGFSQTITFDKSLIAEPQHKFCKLMMVVICFTAKFIHLMLQSEIFIKTNQFGYTEWRKYPEISWLSFNPSKKISKTLDGGYAVVGSKLNGSLQMFV